MLQGFKEFIMKGNVIDLAVGIIIGSAFGAVVNSLVENVLMPAIALAVGEPNFDNWLALGPDGSIKFGMLLTALVNFLLIAAAIYFFIVLPMNKMIEARNRRLGIEPEEEVDPQVALLTEIRDALQRPSTDSGGDHVAR